MSSRLYSYQGKASDWRLIDQRLHPDRLCKLWNVWTDSITINSKPDKPFSDRVLNAITKAEFRKVMPI